MTKNHSFYTLLQYANDTTQYNTNDSFYTLIQYTNNTMPAAHWQSMHQPAQQLLVYLVD